MNKIIDHIEDLAKLSPRIHERQIEVAQLSCENFQPSRIPAGYVRRVELPWLDEGRKCCIELREVTTTFHIDGCEYLIPQIIDTIAVDLENSLRLHINDYDEGRDFSFYSDANDRLSPREAAEVLYKDINDRITRQTAELLGISPDVIGSLSLTPYEGAKAQGNLIIVRLFKAEVTAMESLCVWTESSAATTLELQHIRYIRKLLTSAGDGALLFVAENDEGGTCGVPYFYGVVRKDAIGQFPYHIKIKGYAKWALFETQITKDYSISYRLVFQSTYTGFTATEELSQAELQILCSREFRTGYAPQLFFKIRALSDQRHGTSVLVIDNYSHIDHFTNLADHNKLMTVRRFSDSEADLAYLTSAAGMDGAVVIDAKDGKVLFIATIVDGNSLICGTVARGARFNTVKNFAAHLSKAGVDLITLVFSEDGSTDVFTGTGLRAELAAANTS